VILSRARSKLDLPEIRSQAGALGYSTRFIPCEGPKEMLDALQGLRGQVDLVWCLPDRALYSPASITALILASIRNRLPLIGFSEGFVKAGAPVGFYASYREIGVQTAEAVRRFQEGRPPREKEAPRTIKTAVNERVLRLLGIELRAPNGAGEVVFVR
jgi:putative ABC transport system substrate-binding protein